MIFENRLRELMEKLTLLERYSNTRYYYFVAETFLQNLRMLKFITPDSPVIAEADSFVSRKLGRKSEDSYQ